MAFNHIRHVGDIRDLISVRLTQVPIAGGAAVAVDLTSKTVNVKVLDEEGTEVVAAVATGVTIDPDQVTNKGKLTFKFQSGPAINAGGTFRLFFIIDEGGEKSTFPPEDGYVYKLAPS